MDKMKETLAKHLPEKWRVEVIEISEDEEDTQTVHLLHWTCECQEL